MNDEQNVTPPSNQPQQNATPHNSMPSNQLPPNQFQQNQMPPNQFQPFTTPNMPPIKTKFSTFRMVIGIISIVLFLLISLQSCMAGLGNVIGGSDEASGTAGFILAICMLVAGIVGIVLRNKSTNPAFLVPAGFYIFGAIIAGFNVGSYSDLAIWAFLSAAFGTVHIVFKVFK